MVFKELTDQLASLSRLLLLLNDEQYNKKITYLGNASIGAHSRHVIEMLAGLINGYNTGMVDYINMKRDVVIETNRVVAMMQIEQLIKRIPAADKPLQVSIINSKNEAPYIVSTTFYREVLYNATHLTHHFALIRVALKEMQLELVANDFGVAVSTLQFQSAKK
jgi:hypothetical protein